MTKAKIIADVASADVIIPHQPKRPRLMHAQAASASPLRSEQHMAVVATSSSSSVIEETAIETFFEEGDPDSDDMTEALACALSLSEPPLPSSSAAGFTFGPFVASRVNKAGKSGAFAEFLIRCPFHRDPGDPKG